MGWRPFGWDSHGVGDTGGDNHGVGDPIGGRPYGADNRGVGDAGSTGETPSCCGAGRAEGHPRLFLGRGAGRNRQRGRTGSRACCAPRASSPWRKTPSTAPGTKVGACERGGGGFRHPGLLLVGEQPPPQHRAGRLGAKIASVRSSCPAVWLGFAALSRSSRGAPALIGRTPLPPPSSSPSSARGGRFGALIPANVTFLCPQLAWGRSSR